MKKFSKSKKLENIEVLTDTGWVDVSYIHKTIMYEVWNIRTVNYSLKCADTHIVFDEKMNEIYVKDLVIGAKIQTKTGLEEIISINNLNYSEEMYDLEVDSQEHRYFTSDILSHNTTIAKILAKGHDTLYINTSSERGLDVVKSEIVEFCSTRSLGAYDNEQKVVILDEVDGATEMFFKALRATMEKFHEVRFLATCNYIQKIPDPIQSRFCVLDFMPKNSDEEEELKIKYMKRVKGITKKLNIEWQSQEVLDEFVKRNFPDLRKIVSKIQEFQTSNLEIIEMEHVRMMHYTFRTLFELVTAKPNPEKIYAIIMSEYSNKIDDVLTSFANDFGDWVRENKPGLIVKLPQIFVSIADWEYKKTFMIDKHLALLAMIFSVSSICNS